MNALAHTYYRINWTASHQTDRHSLGNLGSDSTNSRRPLEIPFQSRATDRLGATRPGHRGSQLSPLTPWDALGADIIGRGAPNPGWSAFTESLTGKVGVSWIRAA